ncbi:triose-phosphate isomerase [Candidatus Gottesmanbacteria bacterium RIFCSPLOWO2_01_FULL_48_11]|uniref:Triosephosphate isomerase n=3 Tax=Candidatus Gottesmaniibacteriota TaxID=1752720 RepID=A0A0G1X107_9BACT|nr:MAG: Triosephosphate isomerase [Candidatus Gottesmanbacteria bacterium GW2011_GWA2_47_9]KKU96253.1 MAG: Triosephosphate isomerase [Candidatus Gottesmanbacteria bacterium GW2011_GWA1_48_13]OGG27522.1 MAG: triose-phosphate isomerase [Candidatus Gottesmanbacteria bacterium RIFCSPLOWO2_01_FULL_48_11]
MKSLFIAGNWKSNKTLVEATEWLRNFQFSISNFQLQNTSIVLCVPFTVLFSLKEEIKKQSLPIGLGAQDVSPYKEGAYTGEVSARQIKEFAEWVIIGHSERRRYFGETDEILGQKVAQAKQAGLKIIYCVPDDQTVVADGIDVVAYEPVWAIGTGKADTPENANSVIAAIKQKTGVAQVIYGGSVTADNVAAFVSQPAIDGVLPGGASLDAEKFISLIRVCNQS